MNILITHVYSVENRGDAALLSVLLNDVKNEFKGANINILSLDSVVENEQFEGVPVSNSFMQISRDYGNNLFIKTLFSIFLILYTLIWAVLYKIFKIEINFNSRIHKIISLYKNADLVITVGGGYIRANSGILGTRVLLFILHPIIFSKIINKKIIGYPQSIGPFSNVFQEYLSIKTTQLFDVLIVREKISYDLLKKWRVVKNIYLGIDSGFYFNPDIDDSLIKKVITNQGNGIVGVTVRNWLSPKKQEIYEKNIAKLCDYIIEKYGFNIVFIPQVTVDNHNDNDIYCAQKVFAKINNKKSVIILESKYDYKTIKSIYSKLDYMIGTRFHSVIFSLTSNVPSIAIQYEHKTRGIMRDLGLEEWVINIENVTFENIKLKFDSLVMSKDSYRAKLPKLLDDYKNNNIKPVSYIKNILYKNESI